MIIGQQRSMQKFLPELVFHQDEPIADPVCVPLYYVSKLARETGTIVVQVGEGADEIFAGYDWFRKYLMHLRNVLASGAKAAGFRAPVAGRDREAADGGFLQ